METRNIAITIKKAKEWYYSSNQSLKEVALQAFSKEELEAIHFSKITCFEDVCSVLGLNYTKEINTYNKIATVSKASAASYKLNLTRKALNLGQEMSLLEGKIWCPYTLFVAEGNSYNRSSTEGFHSFSSLERAKKSGPLIGAIVECLIPAGSKIVTGIDKGLIVSDQIIITDVIARI